MLVKAVFLLEVRLENWSLAERKRDSAEGDQRDLDEDED